MNKVNNRLISVLILCTLLILMIPTSAWANAAEPPSVVILVNNPPDDLSIKLVSSEDESEASVRQVAWEGYYSFYSRDMQKDGEYTFKVTSKGESFVFTIDAPLKMYNNIFTLDISNGELKSGVYPFRSVILVAIRLLLTLLLEGIIFWLFKFRDKRSWLVFLIVNIITQGALNIWLNSMGSIIPSYLIFGLIFGEVFVFITEFIAFPVFIREHKKSRVFIYVLVANIVSLVAGGYIISVLPV